MTKLGRRNIYIDFHVIEDDDINLDEFDGILGLDTLNKTDISLHNRTLKFHDSEVFTKIENTTDLKGKNFPNKTICTIDSNHLSRLNKIKPLLDISHLDQKAQSKILEICEKYSNVFFLEGDKHTFTQLIEHPINLHDSVPVNIKQYPIKPGLRHIMDQLLQDLLSNGIIEENYESSWNNPVFLVPKPKKGQYRLVMDARQINKKMSLNQYQLPEIDHILSSLYGKKYFSKLDLRNAFLHIPIKSSDKHKTAFSVPNSKIAQRFNFTGMIAGMADASNTFQRLVEIVFKGLINNILVVFIDDVFIYASTIEEMINNIEICLERLQNANLKIEPSKTVIAKQRVSFLGHDLQPLGSAPGQIKLDIIKNLPIPLTRKELKKNISLMNFFRKYIKDFASISIPIYDAINSKTKFKWTEECDQAFNKLKHEFINVKTLGFPDFKTPFIVSCDASNHSIAGMITQLNQEKEEIPISFCSRRLTQSERNLAVYEKEMLAILYTVTVAHRHLLYGNKFIIRTDHKSLVYLMSTRPDVGSDRIIRAKLRLSEYDFRIVYTPGTSTSHFLPDLLSRLRFEDDENILVPIENLPQGIEIYALTRAMKRKTTNDETLEDYEQFKKSISSLKAPKNVDFITESFSIIDVNKPQIIKIFLTQTNPDFPDEIKDEMRKFIDKNPLSLNEIAFDNEILFYPYKQSEDEIISDQTLFTALTQIKDFLRAKNNKKDVHFANIQNLFLPFSLFHQILAYIFKNENIKVKCFRGTATAIDHIQNKYEIIDKFHSSLVNGAHLGESATYQKLKKIYVWKNMREDIKAQIKACDLCNRNKRKHQPPIPLKAVCSSEDTFQKLFIDLMGKLPETSEGYTFALIAVDDLSRFTIAVPIKDSTSQTIAEALVQHVFLKLGCFQILVSDNAANLNSSTIKNLAKLFRFKKINITPYSANSNGMVERRMQHIKSYIKHYINDDTEWDKLLNFAAFSHNNTVCVTTGKSPNELVFGKNLRMPLEHINENFQHAIEIEDFSSTLKKNLTYMKQIAKQNIIKNRENQKKIYDDRKNVKEMNIEAGQKVYVKAEHRSEKSFKEVWSGPFEVVATQDQYISILIGKNIKKIHKNRIKIGEQA